MRVIIAGSRKFNNYELLKEECRKVLNQLVKDGYFSSRKEVEIICGKARGADTLGEQFAKEYNLNIKYFPADWNLGKSAGYKRNEQMALYAKEDNGILIAFWDGISKGTKHMIDLANKHGLKVYLNKIEVLYE